MKKLILAVLLLGTPLFINAQDDTEQKVANNEIKLNLGYTLAGIPEITYERVLTDDTAIGLSLAVAIEEEVEYNFGVTPYFRLYFSGKRAAGFFVETNAVLFSQDPYYYYYDSFSDEFMMNDSEIGVGLGIAIGGKFLTKSNWIGEIYAGIGRNFVNEDWIDEAYPRLGVLLGKRF